MAKSSSTIIGACGEHFVAAFLSGFDLLVAMPRGGVPGSDLLVANKKHGRPVRVQVKTGTQSTRNTRSDGQIYLWHTSYKAIEFDDENLWYAYVALNDWPKSEVSPNVFFVPSSVVANCMKECKKRGDKVPFFWMRFDDAKIFEGRSGLKALIQSLQT